MVTIICSITAVHWIAHAHAVYFRHLPLISERWRHHRLRFLSLQHSATQRPPSIGSLANEEQFRKIQLNYIKFSQCWDNLKMKSEPSSGGISRPNPNANKQTNESLLIGQIKSKWTKSSDGSRIRGTAAVDWRCVDNELSSMAKTSSTANNLMNPLAFF